MTKFATFASIIALSTTAALADTSVIALPTVLPDGPAEVQQELWTLITTDMGPDDTLTVLNGTEPGQIAKLVVPDDPRFERAKWRVKTLAPQIAEIGAFLESIDTGPAVFDLAGALRHQALARLDTSTPTQLLIIGSMVQEVPDDTGFSFRDGDTLFVPSPSHLSAPVTQTPWGMGIEGATGLQNTSVHLCPVGDGLNSDAAAAYQQFWGSYIAHRGGALVTWSDDLATCFERFTAGITTPLAITPYEAVEGPLSMLEIGRGEVTAKPQTIINGVPVESFNLFASQDHPSLSGVEVTTGIRYEPAEYPERYDSAWCYFSVWEDGVSVRFDLGTKDFAQPVVDGSSTRTALRAGGITRADYDSAKSACQWPTP